MNKSLKIVLEVLIVILILEIVYYFINSNKNSLESNLIDNSDLVCTRVSNASGISTETEIITVRFDKDSIIREYEQKYITKFDNHDDAIKYYDDLKNNNPMDNITINDNEINHNYVIIVDEDDNKYFGKSKTEIKDIYVNEFYYKCE